jgi:hypothetical protein
MNVALHPDHFAFSARCVPQIVEKARKKQEKEAAAALFTFRTPCAVANLSPGAGQSTATCASAPAIWGTSEMPTTVTITRASQLLVDNDNDNVADSGDIIRTFLHLSNTGAQDALNLSVSDNFTGSTLVAGSIKVTPIAFDDSYTGVTGNTPITYSVAQGVLVNDYDPDGAGGNAGVTVTKVNGNAIGGVISISGGSVDMHADGSFTFTPTTGFNGTATFNYSVVDAQGLANVTTATVNIQVNGGMIWYVDNGFGGGGNDGSYLHPFTQLTQLNGVTGDGTTNDDVDGTGDTIFVYHNGGAYSGGITLEAGQTLLGDGQSLLVNGHNIGGTERTGGVDNVATNSVINNAGANGGITLSTDNVIKGLDINGTANGAVGIQDGNGAVSAGINQLVISNVALTGQGQLIDIDQGGKANISLNSLASSGSTGANGGVVDLTGLASGSALTVTGTTSITGTHGQTGIDISGNNGVTVNFQGNVTVNTSANGSNALAIDNNVGTNSVTFGGSANAFTTAAGNAVEMTGNTTATTVNFNNGGLNIDTTTGTGFNVGATTINVAGASNTIDTTTGQILIASNAAVGGSNLAFATLTSTGATTGNAIDINNLDNGSLTVTGNVTIANTGAGFDAVHIVGGSTTNFAFNGNTDINGVGANGDGVELNGANGTVTFANLTVDGMVAGTGNGVLINGATNAVTVSGAIGTGLNTGDALNITGGTAAVTINASIAKNNAGNVAEVNGHATGSISFTGAINASGTASGINLVDNTSGTIAFSNSAVNLNTGGNTALNFTNTAGTGAAVSFTGGNLNIDTTSGTGINATSTTTNAGSLTINGAAANNSVVATSGRAINVDGVTADLTFHDVSKNGGSTTAIFLRNTDGAAHNTGQFVITGTGTTGGTGGTIANIDDAGTNANGATANQTGSAIELTNVSNVSLSNMVFGANATTIANLGIHGEGVNNFTLKGSSFLGNFGDTGATGPDEDAIRFGTQNAANNGLTGTGSFLGNTIQGAAKDNIAIFNGGSGSLNFGYTDLDAGHQAVMGNNQTGANTGIQIQTGGTAGGQGGGFSLTASITNAQFTGTRADAIFIEALQHTTQNITVTGNAFTNNQADKAGGFVNVNGGGAAGTNYFVTYNVSNNTMTGAVTTPIVGVYNGQDGKIAGVIANNTIGTPGGGTDSTGSSQGNGIFVAVDRAGNTVGAGTLNYAVRIDTNNIHDLFQASGGIAVRANNAGAVGTARIEATIQGNTVNELGTQALSALFLQLGGGTTQPDNGILGIDLKNNSFTTTANQLAVVDIDQISTSANLNVPNYPAANPTSGQAAANALTTFWTTTNTNTFTVGGAAFSTYGAGLNGVTHNAFTNAVPMMAVVPTVVPWEDDPANRIVVTSDQGDPAVTVGVAPDAGFNTPGTGGHLTPTGPTGGPATVQVDPTPDTPGVVIHDAPAVVDDGVVSQAELNLIVDAAIQRWAEAGASADQLAAMHAVQVTVSEMMGLYIGASTAGQIKIDSDGAGYGWFIDATPNDDAEYDGSGTRLTADPADPAAVHHIDLLTVVMHELGHQVGLDDTYAAAKADDLMYGFLNPGERRLPASGEAEGAVAGSLAHEEYAIGPITSVTDLPAGKGVDIIFDTMVDTFSNQVIPTFNNQATVSGTNVTGSPVTSNIETLVVDSLTLGDRIFLDANNNGGFDAGEGVNGVTLTLYADSNGNGVLDGAELTNVLAVATTAGGGLYSFSGLAPGDYVVSVDAANFTGGGALAGKVSIAGGADPDDNADNDDNGIAGPGGTVISAPIRLDMNSEPTAGTGNDTNNTLDFGFVSLNQAPVNTVPGAQAVNEDASLTFTGGNAISVADPDVGGGNLTVTLSVSHGVLTLGGIAGLAFGTGDGTADATMTFTGTQVAVNSALNGLIYAPASNYNGSDTLTITTNDNGNTGADPGLTGDANSEEDTDTVTINVAAINDTPALVVATPLASTEQVFATIDASATVHDADLDALNGGSGDYGGSTLTVARQGGANADDTFQFTASGSFTVNGGNLEAPGGLVFASFTNSGGTLTVTFNDSAATATTALVNAVLDAVQYANSNDTPPASIDLDVSLNDGAPANAGQGSVAGHPATGTATVHVNITDTPEDQAPVVDLDADDSSGATGLDYATTYTEGGAAVALADTDVSITDADVGDNITGATISISDVEAGDRLTVIGSLPGSIVAAGGGTDTITLSGTGTRAEYQQALTQIAFSSTSNNPTAMGTHTDRTIGVIVNDGTLNSLPATVTVTVVGVDQAPVAKPDAFVTDEATVVNDSVFVSHGSGPDTDPDGPPLSVSAVNGSGANVGVQTTLASGALLTLNANGTFSYDPNHVFDKLPAQDSGAANVPGHDSFTYTLTGGNTVTVSLTVKGLDGDDYLPGTAGNDSLSGGAGRDVLVGLGGDDFLSGGAGAANEMIGGLGNDTYFVQSVGDTIVENPGEGTDRVLTTLSNYSLESLPNIENLSALGSDDKVLTGNDGDNIIISDGGNDKLYGGLGHDVLIGGAGDDILSGGTGVANEMYGGAGNDKYIVSAAGDTLVENPGEGIDTVYANVSLYFMHDNFENLIFTGTGNFTGIGNTAANTIVGGAGDDVLDGGAGAANLLIGGAGNDTYVVQVAGDTIVEQAGGGTDTVETALSSYTLGANLENLTFTDGGSFFGTGNALDNVISGGNANDILDGGLGADTLIGHGGSDGFLFDTALGGGNVDTIGDFQPNIDHLLLDNNIFTAINEGSLDPSQFVVGTSAQDANDRILYDATTGNLYYDADGNGAGAAVLFATLQGHPTIIASDIIVI